MSRIFAYLAKEIAKNTQINNPIPISLQARSNPTTPIPMNKNTRFSKLYAIVWYKRFTTFFPVSLKFGNAYRAIAIPQNIMLIMPDMSKP